MQQKTDLTPVQAGRGVPSLEKEQEKCLHPKHLPPALPCLLIPIQPSSLIQLLPPGANTIPVPHQHRAAPRRVRVPEMVAAVSSASRRSFSSRSFSSSRWCCRCRSSIFFWCVSSMAAKPLSHVACKRDEGKGLARERGAEITAVGSPSGAAHQRVVGTQLPSSGSSPSPARQELAEDGPHEVRACPAAARPLAAPGRRTDKGRSGVRCEQGVQTGKKRLVCPFCSPLQSLLPGGATSGWKAEGS